MSEQFKDTMLNRITGGWRSTDLAEFATCLSGFAFSSHGFNDESGIRLVRIRDLLGGEGDVTYFRGPFEDRYLVQDGDLLVGMDGDFNAVEWTGGRALLNQRVCRVAPKFGNNLDARYLRHILQPILHSIHRATPQTTVRHLTAKALLAFPVVLPPYPEQRRIAEILDTVDDAIRQTERVIAKLEQVKAGMLHDLLTRGIDGNGEVRDPERHPEQFKDSPLGRIPKGWSVRALATLASEITSGATPTSGSTRYYCAAGGLPFAKIDDLTASATRFIGQTALQVTRVALRETALVEYPAGTLLLSMYGTIGLVKTTVRPMCANQALAALVPPFDCDSAFLAHVLEWCRPKWDRFKAQTTQANINGRIVKEFLLPVPPEPEQRRIAERLDHHQSRLRQEAIALEKLRATKQALADDLLTGRVRVNTREAVPA